MQPVSSLNSSGRYLIQIEFVFRFKFYALWMIDSVNTLQLWKIIEPEITNLHNI